MNLHKLFTAAMWAGVISLDFTACGPFMVSQPLVCGPLFGWLMGQTAVGLIIGGTVQLLWMDLSPIGVGIPYDATATTLLSVYWATRNAHGALSQVVLALVLAVPFGFFFRWFDQLARRLNTLLMHRVERFSDERLAAGLWVGIFGGITWSWIRYVFIYMVFFGLGEIAWNRIAYSPRLTPIDQGLTMAVLLLPVAGMGVTLELFLSDDPEGRWAPWRASPKGRTSSEDRRTAKPTDPENPA
jgi:mannose/fructose/N-acetylgalactosamine-specific phosphotransferase system component IIC